MNTHSTTVPNANPDNSSTADTLTDLEQRTWQQLAAVLADTQDSAVPTGFKTMVVATCSPSGADARTVVLRKVNAAHKYVWFHTDARAAKVMQLEAFPNATLLFWDDKLQCQLRLSVETRLHTDDYIADEHWQHLAVSSRKVYLSEYQPGKVLPAPYPGFPEELGENLPSKEASEAGRKNFAVIECRILAMEYLHLSRSGQTRAFFQYEPESRMVWLAP
jgi:hypothetical protein